MDGWLRGPGGFRFLAKMAGKMATTLMLHFAF